MSNFGKTKLFEDSEVMNNQLGVDICLCCLHDDKILNEPRRSEDIEERRVLEGFCVSSGKLCLLDIFCYNPGKLALTITQGFVFYYLVKEFDL